MTEIKDIVKPPFQNYDIVVYFGCGLFSLPFLHHYVIKPFGARFPHFSFGIGSPFADEAVSTLSLLFSVYLLGHLIAYAGSVVVEKTIDRALGKMSSSVIISLVTSKRRLPISIRSWIGRRIYLAFSKGKRFTSSIRAILLLPVSAGVIASYLINNFGYFKTRIPKSIFDKIRDKCISEGYGRVSLHTQWYKALEHDVINNCPSATARMYNYLVISGIFRSLSIIFLCSAWAELYYLLHYYIDGDRLVDAVMSDSPSKWSGLINLAGFNFLFAFTITAYVKFSRRYIEEAMFAFVLTKSS